MTFKLGYAAPPAREIEAAFAGVERSMARAATATMVWAAGEMKRRGRAEFARAGFSQRAQNAFRSESYPTGRKVSLAPAAYAWHNFRWAGIWEEGAEIAGKPDLFLPLDTVPKRLGARRLTPALFRERIGPLAFVERPGKPPLLVAKVGLTRGQARRRRPRVSLAALRRGAGGDPGAAAIRSLPIFIGVPRVRVHKQVSIGRVVEGIAAELPGVYAEKIDRGL